LVVVEDGGGSDFTEDHNHTSLSAGLAGNLGVGVSLQASVQNSVGDLVAHLVRMAFRDALGSEEERLKRRACVRH
jgi:hypothetical protein